MDSVYDYLEMAVRSCTVSGISYCGYGLSLEYTFSCGYIQCAAMSVECLHAAAMVDYYRIAVSVVPSCQGDPSSVRSLDRGSC